MSDVSLVPLIVADTPVPAVEPSHVRVTVFDDGKQSIYAFVSEHVLSFMFRQNHSWWNEAEEAFWDNWKTELQVWFSFKRVNKDGSRPLHVYGKKRPRRGSFKNGLFRNWNLTLGDNNSQLGYGVNDRGSVFALVNGQISDSSVRDKALLAQPVARELLSIFFSEHGFEVGDVDSFEKIAGVVFPGFALSKRPLPAMISPHVSTALRAKDARTVTARLVGKRRVRRDLVREVALVDSVNLLEMIPYLVRVVPVDWIVQGLQERRSLTVDERGYSEVIHMEAGASRRYLQGLAEMLALFPPGVQRRLVTNLMTMRDANTYLIRDTCVTSKRAVESGIRVEDIRVTSIRDLHDQLVDLNRRRFEMDRLRADNERAALNRARYAGVIEMVAVAELFVDKTTPSGFTLVPASSGEQVVDWSLKMQNCIDTYITRAQTGRTVLLGVYKGGILVANAEVANNTLTQLYGERNARLEVEVEAEIVGTMKTLMPSLASPRFGMFAADAPDIDLDF